MEPAEYEETKNDTIEQLKELNDSLKKLVKGDISLVSALGAVQLVLSCFALVQLILSRQTLLGNTSSYFASIPDSRSDPIVRETRTFPIT